MALIDDLRTRAEATQAELSRLADALGTLEAEEKQLSGVIRAAGLDTKPLDIAAQQARLGQLERAIAEQRPVVVRARADASSAAGALSHAEAQLTQAQAWHARLIAARRDDGPVAILLAPWWMQLDHARQIITRLTGQAPPELPTHPPVPEVELV